jgi:hypothetical protein
MMTLIPKREHKVNDHRNEHREKCSICGVEGILVENFPRRL